MAMMVMSHEKRAVVIIAAAAKIRTIVVGNVKDPNVVERSMVVEAIIIEVIVGHPDRDVVEYHHHRGGMGVIEEIVPDPVLLLCQNRISWVISILVLGCHTRQKYNMAGYDGSVNVIRGLQFTGV
mmetsp:Transcript_39429/g.82444  ORF Transcript_39429/g.82444 Transcript_39429/m.82444 type:complete len:125 (-) Transcript_39429:14-388(-)